MPCPFCLRLEEISEELTRMSVTESLIPISVTGVTGRCRSTGFQERQRHECHERHGPLSLKQNPSVLSDPPGSSSRVLP
jgi:hypothetical protein